MTEWTEYLYLDGDGPVPKDGLIRQSQAALHHPVLPHHLAAVLDLVVVGVLHTETALQQ